MKNQFKLIFAILLLCFVLLPISPATSAEIYKWKDKDGNVFYSDVPPPAGMDAEMKKFKEALEEFSKIDPAKLGVASPDFQYNLGNTFFRLEQYDRALQGYKNNLLLRPEDIDAKKNYELTLKKQEEQKKQDNPQQNQNRQNQPNIDPKQNYGAMLQFLNQEEKDQMEKKKRKSQRARNERDW